MSFQHTSKDIRIVQEGDSTYLTANAREKDGDWNHARIRLDGFIGNDDGHFQWGGVNFTHSAKDITFSMEGPGSEPILRAELADRKGAYHASELNLAKNIENQDGKLVYI